MPLNRRSIRRLHHEPSSARRCDSAAPLSDATVQGVSRKSSSWNRFLPAGVVVGFCLLCLGATSAHAAPTTMVDLGAASPYAVLSGASVGNTVSAPGAPHTTIRGDLGIKADTAPTGFPPGEVTGTIRHGSAVDQAHADATSAYNEIKLRTGGQVIPGALVGAVLTPGLYTIAAAASNTGTLTLDGEGDPDAIFVFQVNGALAFAAGSHVVLTNGAQASRVFWQVNGAGAIGALSDFVGTMIALDAVGIGNGTLVNGRAMALTGALTLDNNQFYGAAPVVTIEGGATAYTTDTTPTLTGTTTLDPPGQVTVTIAGQTLSATPAAGIWSVTSGILANNVYQVEVTVTDAVGNRGSASQQLTVDTIPPEITLDGNPDVITNLLTPTISGTSDAAADTVVRVTIASQHLRALVQSDQSWNIRAASLPAGTYQVTASVTDPAGNESNTSQSLTIDNTPPAVTIAGGPNAHTTNPTPTLNGFANVSPGTTVKVIVANQTLSAVVDQSQLWSVTTDPLPDGLHRFIVIVTDAAGNTTRTEHLLTVARYTPPIVAVDPVPSITKLAVLPRKIPLSGGSKSAMSKLGPLIDLYLSELATVNLQITSKSSRASQFQAACPAGVSLMRVPRKLRKSMGRGTYRLAASAIDSIGQVSEVKRTTFRVIR